MAQRVNRNASGERQPRPLDPAKLQDLALGYVGRFATSGAKLERYLQRKLRERGWAGEAEPDVGALVARLCELKYVDDAAYAAARTGSLLRRGYGPRRVAQALNEAGIDEDTRAAVRPSIAAERDAVLAFARKRRFGPFATDPPDRERREKQLAAVLRAGHRLDSAREIVNAPTIAAAERWAAEAEDEEG